VVPAARPPAATAGFVCSHSKESFVKRYLLLAMAGALLGTASCQAAENKNPVVVMETSLGTIKIELNEEKAPICVKNFLGYVDDKFYDGTICHRVIPNFMVQGGGFEPGLKEKQTKDPIKNESYNGLTNDRGTIAMARTNKPDSATAQFYINHGEKNDFLNKAKARDGVGYAVFGKVIEGMDVVDKIAAVETGSRDGMDDVPVKDVIIKSIRRAEAK
jgi:cyclophilin family peptidyl-prolyl cis-trans isomerase